MTKGGKTLNLTVGQSGDQECYGRDVLEGFEYSLVWNDLSTSISIDSSSKLSS